MKVEIICPYCQAHDQIDVEDADFVRHVTCDDGTGASGCGKPFYIEGKATQWTLDYYTNYRKGL